MRLSVQRRRLRLASALETSYGAVREREILGVSLTDADGLSGYGEAAPLQAYDGVSVERVARALEAYAPVLADSEGKNGAQLIDACRAVEDLPAAFAAVDMALWDRAGRRAGRPVAALLTDGPAAAVPVNATLSALDRAGAAGEAAAAVAAGFRCLKLKVGVGDDAGRVAAVRAAVGPEIDLRLDANGAWDVEQAVRAIELLARPGWPRRGADARSRGGARGARARRGARRDRRDRGRARRARRGRGRRGLPEDLSLRGHLRLDRGGDARQSLGGRGVCSVHASTGRSGWPRRCTPPPRSPRGVRSRHVDWQRSRCSRISRTRCRCGGEIALPTAGGLGIDPL